MHLDRTTLRAHTARIAATTLTVILASACGDDTSPASDAGTSTDTGVGPTDTGLPPDSGVIAPECTTHAECATAEKPYCDAEGACAAPPPAGALGWGDGSAASVTFEKILDAARTGREAPDLEFNPVRPTELWVLNRMPASNEPCGQASATNAGCAALEGSVTIIHDAESAGRRAEWKKDGNAWHFMRRPPALAFGTDDTFATCGEERTGNYLDGFGDFIGPTLWSSDPQIFAITPPGGNGSHLDMLHASPWCVGIAHESQNIYWVFNGLAGSLDRYNFNMDHGPGNDDHSDGEIYRYAAGEFKRVPNVPSHMVYSDDKVYVADTDGGRILVLDATSGTPAGPVDPVYEPFQETQTYANATVTELVAAGTLTRPSGLELYEGHLYVSDHETSQIHAFDLEGNLVRTLQTELPARSLAGLAFGPTGILYFADLNTSDVYRVLVK